MWTISCTRDWGLWRLAVHIVRLHSHLLGEEETSQEHAECAAAGEGRQLFLSSLVAARGVTLPDIKYVFIHPHNRTTYLHQSGLDTLGDERISAELSANEAGRGGRTAAGHVVYLFEFDDSEEALLKLRDAREAENPSWPRDRTLPERSSAGTRRPSPSSPPATPRGTLRAPPRIAFREQRAATLILGPPTRLAYIHATMRQLQENRFPNIYWLRLPDPVELDELLGTTLKPQQRVMALWRTFILPAVVQVCAQCEYAGALVVEDTVLLAPDVTYEEVAREIRKKQAPAGVWGYGKWWVKQKPTAEQGLDGRVRKVCG